MGCSFVRNGSSVSPPWIIISQAEMWDVAKQQEQAETAKLPSFSVFLIPFRAAPAFTPHWIEGPKGTPKDSSWMPPNELWSLVPCAAKCTLLLNFGLDVIYLSWLGRVLKQQSRIGGQRQFLRDVVFGPEHNPFHLVGAELILKRSHGRKGVNDGVPSSAGFPPSPQIGTGCVPLLLSPQMFSLRGPLWDALKNYSSDQRTFLVECSRSSSNPGSYNKWGPERLNGDFSRSQSPLLAQRRLEACLLTSDLVPFPLLSRWATQCYCAFLLSDSLSDASHASQTLKINEQWLFAISLLLELELFFYP